MPSLLEVTKSNLGNILTAVTLVGLAFNYLATKKDVENVGTNVTMLRMELTIRVNENKLSDLDKIVAKTAAHNREIAALTASNLRLAGKLEDILNDKN